jgi:hypothetical protein
VILRGLGYFDYLAFELRLNITVKLMALFPENRIKGVRIDGLLNFNFTCKESFLSFLFFLNVVHGSDLCIINRYFLPAERLLMCG